MPNFKLVLCYEGTRYNGWQKQGNTPRTIQEKLESALGGALGIPVDLAGSGRTDAGVHARRQVSSFRADTRMTPEEILLTLRALLPEDIGAVSLEIAPPRFHARLSCRDKTYVYRIWNSALPNVFERRTMFQIPEPLDLDRMRKAAAQLLGSHDFSAFCANKHMKKSAVRTLYDISINREGDEVRLSFSGNGFLYNMARIMAGTLIQCGQGLMLPGEMAGILRSKDRLQAGPTAPAQGLTLWEVNY